MTVPSQVVASDSKFLVTFSYGTTSKHYTDWSRRVVRAGIIYTPSPTMEIQLPERNGVLEESNLKMMMGRDSFTDRISSGEPHAQISVKIQELEESPIGTSEDRLLSEDFNDVSDGQLPASWTVVDQGNTLTSDWEVQSGELQQNGNITNLPAFPPLVKGTFLRFDGGFTWDDYKIRATLRSDSDDDDIGIMFRVVDSNNYYRFSIRDATVDPFRRLVKVQNGVATTLAEDGGGFVQNTNFTVLIEARNRSLIVKINNVTILRADDDTFSTGTIALYCSANSGARFEDVFVSDLSSDSFLSSLKTMYVGTILRAIRNYQGRQNRVRIEGIVFKSKLDIPLGIPANPQCPWTFGNEKGSPCQIDLVPLRQVGLVTEIEDNLVRIIDLPVRPVLTDPNQDSAQINYWQEGYVEKDGLRLKITSWDRNRPERFYLSSFPRKEWLDEDVTVTPGCGGTIFVCRHRWMNENRFAGFGIGMPNYNPIFESPDAGSIFT
jgi:hypothetical protein